ncbi:MAG TPA: hypothetical protein VMT30_06490 [Candidatus Saccharimonadia bacterium]|nr:hypothetical protein [Candidatus Saccharimonadia bacterium]
MKAVSLLRRTLLTLTAGAAGAAFAVSAPAHAATSQSYQISPPTANYTGNKGGIQSGTIKVTNLTGAPLSVRTGKENFVAKGEEGEIELVDAADPLYSLAPWFSLNAAQLDIPALGTKELHYTIAIPTDAEPGGRYGSIVFSTIPPKLASGESGAAVQQTIAGIVFMRIDGQANEQLEVASFGAEKSFYDYGPVKFLTRIKNTGTVHEKATGTITIKNMLGFKVATIPLDEHFVIPGAIRRLHNDWPTGGQHPFLFGRYTATLDAKYGNGQTLTASASFTVVPWKLVALIVVGLLAVIVIFWRGRPRFARAFRILAGRE